MGAICASGEADAPQATVINVAEKKSDEPERQDVSNDNDINNEPPPTPNEKLAPQPEPEPQVEPEPQIEPEPEPKLEPEPEPAELDTEREQKLDDKPEPDCDTQVKKHAEQTNDASAQELEADDAQTIDRQIEHVKNMIEDTRQKFFQATDDDRDSAKVNLIDQTNNAITTASQLKSKYAEECKQVETEEALLSVRANLNKARIFELEMKQIYAQNECMFVQTEEEMLIAQVKLKQSDVAVLKEKIEQAEIAVQDATSDDDKANAKETLKIEQDALAVSENELKEAQQAVSAANEQESIESQMEDIRKSANDARQEYFDATDEERDVKQTNMMDVTTNAIENAKQLILKYAEECKQAETEAALLAVRANLNKVRVFELEMKQIYAQNECMLVQNENEMLAAQVKLKESDLNVIKEKVEQAQYAIQDAKNEDDKEQAEATLKTEQEALTEAEKLLEEAKLACNSVDAELTKLKQAVDDARDKFMQAPDDESHKTNLIDATKTAIETTQTLFDKYSEECKQATTEEALINVRTNANKARTCHLEMKQILAQNECMFVQNETEMLLAQVKLKQADLELIQWKIQVAEGDIMDAKTDEQKAEAEERLKTEQESLVNAEKELESAEAQNMAATAESNQDESNQDESNQDGSNQASNIQTEIEGIKQPADDARQEYFDATDDNREEKQTNMIDVTNNTIENAKQLILKYAEECKQAETEEALLTVRTNLNKARVFELEMKQILEQNQCMLVQNENGMLIQQVNLKQADLNLIKEKVEQAQYAIQDATNDEDKQKAEDTLKTEQEALAEAEKLLQDAKNAVPNPIDGEMEKIKSKVEEARKLFMDSPDEDANKANMMDESTNAIESAHTLLEKYADECKTAETEEDLLKIRASLNKARIFELEMKQIFEQNQCMLVQNEEEMLAQQVKLKEADFNVIKEKVEQAEYAIQDATNDDDKARAEEMLKTEQEALGVAETALKEAQDAIPAPE